MNWFSKRRDPGAWRRSRPGLEALEGRRLLANSRIATTLDANGNPLFVAVQPSGAVVVNQERPTNDVANPSQYTGYQTLPGLTAASVTAATLPNGDPVVYAKPRAVSYLFANEYLATGDPARPFAWSGWQRVGGDFVNVSATAATSGATSAVFAIGADAQVYAATVVPATTPGTAATLSAFRKLPALGAASIAVQADGAGRFEVAALAGPRTYVYGSRVTLAAAPMSTGWQQLGNFVATSIDVTPGLNTTAFGGPLGDRLFLFAVGTDGNVYYDPLVPNTTTGNRDSTTYTVIGGGAMVATRASISLGYMTVYEVDAQGIVYQNELLATGLAENPIISISNFVLNYSSDLMTIPFRATDLAVGPRLDGGFDLLAATTDGTVRVDRQDPHAALTVTGLGYSPITNSFEGFTDLASRAVHPIAASAGPGGGNVVVSLGSDGTVYASTAGATTTENPAPAFSAFAPLSGLTATSIAAAQLNTTGEMAVYALTGTSSLVFENQYLATGDPTTPYTWTGWRPLGSFVARAIAAAYTAGADQASVFAIGLDGVVAATDRSANQPNPTAATFTPLAGLTAASIAVRGYDEATVEVVAINGTPGVGFARFYQPAGVQVASTTSLPTGQWFFAGNYILGQAAGGRNGKYVVGVSPYGFEAATSAYQATDPTVATNYVALNFAQTAAFNVRFQRYQTAGLVSISSATSDASIQLVISNPLAPVTTNPPANVYIATGGGTVTSATVDSPTLPNGSVFRTLGASTAAIESEYYVGDTLGRIYVSRFAVARTASATTFTAYALVGTLPT